MFCVQVCRCSKMAIQAACGAQRSATSGQGVNTSSPQQRHGIPASPTSCMCPAADYTYSLPMFTCARVVADTTERISIICVLLQLSYEVNPSPTFLHRAFA